MESFPEKIGLGPKGVEFRPEFDPNRVPSNASPGSRFDRAGIGIIRAIAEIIGSAGRAIIKIGPVVTPVLKNVECNYNPSKCFRAPPT
jgi:hypothetical protein